MLVSITISAFQLAHIRHGFFTRQGGVSTGIYESLNCRLASADNLANAQENRARVAAAMGVAPTHLVGTYQHHSATVITVDGPLVERPKADAMVTCTAGIALGVLAADCAPILFADRQRSIIGAAHAGWRGALAGVTDNTVIAMRTLGASDIVAAIGPCIRQPSYEVGAEFPAPFIAQDSAFALFFTPLTNGKFLFDLAGYITARLQRLDVTVTDCGLDTYPDATRFFSCRRAAHAGEADFGNQINCITIT